MHVLYGLILTAAVLAMAGCSASTPYVARHHQDWQRVAPPPDDRLVYRVFLVGDAGSPPTEGYVDPLPLLRTQLAEAGDRGAVVFLGDNIYCCGLPDSASAARERAESRLLRQLEAVRDFEGRVVFLPGNHDWNNSDAGGLETLARQEDYIEAYLDDDDAFLPNDGFPGPEVVRLTDDIVLVALDTEWWLTRQERATGDAGDYEVAEEGDVLLQLTDILNTYDDAHVLVAGHHPLFSNGPHAGRFPLKTHVFPLTEIWENAYVPLPGLGSLVPLFVRVFGTRQDLAHPAYRSLRDGLERAFGEHESLIYASGHEHSLQYFEGLLHNYVVSGAAARPEHVARGGKASFTYGSTGYARLNYYDDGSVWLEMWTPDDAGGRLVFRASVKGASRDAVDPGLPDATRAFYPDYSDSTAVVAANPGYMKSSVYEFFLGRHNREIWGIPVRVPYLDLGREAGGLTPVKRGGGMQTFSLRLQGGDGHEYALRSIDKDPSVSLPPQFRETVARDVVQDQIASIHPYGAYPIPRLAEAAGIYHSVPRLFFVPDDPRLGVYRETFGNQLMMLELRPDDDMSAFPNFGFSDDVVSETTMYEKITEDNDDRVDVPAFVRARLFDMLLSDWDRHKGQWRWAEFDDTDGKGKLYRPIPKDRDWAFNRFNGLLPSLARIGFDPKFQEFDVRYGDLKGLSLNGLPQDRRLAGPAGRDVWRDQAAHLVEALSDTVIEAAIADLPEAVAAYHGDRLATILKARRDQLPEVADRYYALIARRVDLLGSDKHERFEVHRLDAERTEIVVYKTTKEGETRSEMYRRTFHRSETSEVVLYGLDGNDRFQIRGDVATGIAIRAVGGEGEDVFDDQSRVNRGGRKAIFYDTPAFSTVDAAGPNARIVRSDNPAVNAYDPLEFSYNTTGPQVFFGFNEDDGLYLGGGARFVRHGFRKKPYAASHRLVGNLAARTGAYNAIYEGAFVDVLGATDMALEASVRSPRNIRNYFGLGNETENTQEIATFYQARLAQLRLAPSFIFGGPSASLSVGGHLRFTDVEDEAAGIIAQLGISPESFDDQWFAGLNGALRIDQTDRSDNPRQGIRWLSDAEFNAGLFNTDDVYGRLSSSLAHFASPSLFPQVTLASRVGASHMIGSFPFFEASTIGGRRTVRGWRSNRFAGRTAAYANAELRAELLDFSTYVAIGSLGVLGFFDIGRVWTEADASPGSVWHTGYGGGIWLDMFDAVVLTGTLGLSKEDALFGLRFGFLY